MDNKHTTSVVNATSIDESRIILEFGKRVAMLRRERGLVQTEFAKELAAFCGYSEPIAITSISSWEQSRRFPVTKMIVALAMFFEVSCDYLFGITDDRTASPYKTQRPDSGIQNYDPVPIKSTDYPCYDGRPVFVVFKNSSYVNQWGIMDATHNRVICREFTVELNHNINCYAFVTPAPIRRRISSIRQLNANEYVWIEMISQDQGIRSLYNGRYKHSPNKDCLINMSDGRVLPYEGLDISFWAFVE